MSKREQRISLLLREYPNATPDMFAFGYNMDSSGKSVKSVDIYFKSGPKYSDYIDLKSAKFKGEWRKYLGNPTTFPRIWRNGGTTPKLLLTDQVR